MKFVHSCRKRMVLVALVTVFIDISYHVMSSESFNLFLKKLLVPSLHYPETCSIITTGEHASSVIAQSTNLPPVQSTSLPPVQSTNLPPVQSTSLPPVQSTNLPPVQSTNLPPVQSTSLPPVQSTNLPPVQSTSLPPVQSTSLSPVTFSNVSRKEVKKYLIYLCDKDEYCFGLGDRQRGIVGVFFLANLTNRQFGIKMAYPWPFQDFYMPNQVPWDIPDEELQGKSTKVIKYFKPQTGELEHINFNQMYQEEVIYIRTNFQLWVPLAKNSLYRPNFPPWALGRRSRLFSTAWVHLTTPTPELRSSLNHLLVEIAQSMLNSSQGAGNSSQGVGNSSSEIAPNTTLPPSLKPAMTLEQIKQLDGYDVAKLNLICVHVRVGFHSNAIPLETTFRNTLDSVTGVWKFLRPYIQKGHHVYLATDNTQVRSQAKALFGDRVHSVDAPVVHVATVLKDQNPRDGFKTALLEQLLLMTSCQALVVSRSGCSMMASYVRLKLIGYSENYYFEGGQVVKWNVW